MAVTDLTGTTWVFNDIITINDNYSWDINFISNNTNFAFIKHSTSFSGILNYLDGEQNSTGVYAGNRWRNEAYKTITITGGTGATSTTLISWLQANATLQTPTISFKHLYRNTTLIGTGTYKFRPYTVSQPLPQLSTPVNVSADGTTVSWDEVENATSYEILADGTSIGTVEGIATNFTLSDGSTLLTSDGQIFNVKEN